MIPRWIPRLAAAGVALAASGPVLAATASTNNTQSSCTDCTVVIDWNPTLNCDDPISDGYDLIDCLLASGPPGCRSNPIQQPAPPDPFGGGQQNQNLEPSLEPESGDGCLVTHETGNYWVEPLPDPPPFGLQIRREDLTEIDRLHFWEDYPEMTSIEIFVDQPDLKAQIGEITGTPSSGMIEVILNGRRVQVDTAFQIDALQVTQALVDAIRRARFKVQHIHPYIEVDRDELLGAGLTRIHFASTDPGIVQSEVALEPRVRTGDPALGGLDSGR